MSDRMVHADHVRPVILSKRLSTMSGPDFLNLGAEGTRGLQQMPLAACAAPIQESVLPISMVGSSLLFRFAIIGPWVWISAVIKMSP